ncbi:MAG TPA: hypothetical protein PKC76_15175 [Saprospiraceae bacterium]|mgnify:CR=1 FL=1|nr:hypothetical protein [Saprospiraceae bacterium]HMP25476.1 hypothetical protein [Saprospiraceae bacterium]
MHHKGYFVWWSLSWALIFFNPALGQENIYIPDSTIDNKNSYTSYKKLLLYSHKEDLSDPRSDHKHNIFISYYHLKAPSDTVFKYMRQAIDFDPVTECDLIFKGDYPFIKICSRFYCPEKMEKVKNLCDSVYSSFDSTLIDILSIIKESDQKYRADQKYSPWIKGNESYWEEQAIIDSINILLVNKILLRHGYPGRQKVGRELEDVAFMVIQHADIKNQEKHLYIIKNAVEQRQLYKSAYPLLVDRIRMKKHLPQIYGTQLVHNKKRDRLELYKMESLEGIDELRAKYGLSTLRSYLERTGAFMPEN